jgi:hypothetical protein
VSALSLSLLFLIGLNAGTRDRHESSPALLELAGPSSPQVDVTVAANQLLAAVKQWLSAQPAFPGFAREKVAWVTAQQKAGLLSLLLLQNASATNLDPEAFMASGIVEGRPVIVIPRVRFAAFLAEGGRAQPPFNPQQRNDFLLGLVHEAVHLQHDDRGDPSRLEDRLNEETRTWRDVDINVVRPLLVLHEPLNPRYREADEALRSCGDAEGCESLKALLVSSEANRQ